MVIDRHRCPTCSGEGKITRWVDERHPDGSATLRPKEDVCYQCDGKGYIGPPVFTVEEAIKIAEHFGFEVIGSEV